MKVFWTREAQQDRESIWDYIAKDSASAATAIDILFSDAAARLADFPLLGRPGKISGTRELLPHESYRLVYENYNDAVLDIGAGPYSAPMAAFGRLLSGAIVYDRT